MKSVRFGVVGLGNMGVPHARNCKENGGTMVKLGAVCDIVPEKAEGIGKELGVPYFTDHREMIASGECDAVIIATPHYWHPSIGIRAARAGLHVLCEKPLASTVGPARVMIDECKKQKVAFGCVLHHRTRTAMIKLRKMIEADTIGDVFRVQLICSSWFRTQAYYDSGAWRGTWDGEGGGVLINQAPHHLDLFQWMAGGLPQRITASIDTRDHKIEVEDTANVILDYGKGKVGYIYATTAEQPGMEQMTIVGTKGTLVFEKGKLMHGKLHHPIEKSIYGVKGQDVIKTPGGGKQKITWKEVKLPKNAGGTHLEIIKGFARHVVKGTPMYIDGTEAIKELEISNAAYISGFKNKVVEMPVDAGEIERLIKQLEKERSTGKGGGMRAEAEKDFQKLMRQRAKRKTSRKTPVKNRPGKAAKKKTRKKSAKK
jgi:predicted dehydrogenase